MVMDVARIEIAELATLLEARENENQRIALILGSRTGALARSSELLTQEINAYLSQLSFSHNERERFSECYASLSTLRKEIWSRDLLELLNKPIESVAFSTVDDCLARLVKQRIFKVILSFNPDDILYHAFQASGLKKDDDFVEFSFSQHSVDKIVPSTRRRDACKVIKFFHDVEDFINSLNNPSARDELAPHVRILLERMYIKKVLVVGIDPRWDEIIFSALPGRFIKTVWFVNEDEQVKDAFRAAYPKIEDFRHVTGWHGTYEKFLLSLYFHLNQGIPPLLYEKTLWLENQFNVIQSNLTTIKDGIKNLHDELADVQHKILELSRNIKDASNRERDERG